MLYSQKTKKVKLCLVAPLKCPTKSLLKGKWIVNV